MQMGVEGNRTLGSVTETEESLQNSLLALVVQEP